MQKNQVLLFTLFTILVLLAVAVYLFLRKETVKEPDPLDRKLVIALSVSRFDEARDLIMKGADVNHLFEPSQRIEEDYHFVGWRPLHIASFLGNVKSVELLIEKGADPDATIDYKLYTTSHIVLAKGDIKPEVAEADVTQIIALLVGGGSNPNLRDEHGRTPLFLAIEAGYSEAVKILVENGAKVNLKDEIGLSPLIFAVSNQRTDSIEWVR